MNLPKVATLDFATPPPQGETRFLLDGVEWPMYKTFCKAAEGNGGMRVSYLDGTIELMFPSYEHESRKSRIGGLLECFLVKRKISFFEHGSSTLKKELKKAGKEPDESYCFHRQNKTPDLVIEVAITSGGLDTLEIYRRWRIAEVWIWKSEKLQIFVLEADRYKKTTKSQLLPDLDIKLLSRCVLMEDGLRARETFLASLE